MKKGFTLAEIMIVLIVIAVLSAILLPAARNIMPNKKIAKFKKGHEALYKAMNELIVSDEYYLNGDFGTKINGERTRTSISEDRKYFCESVSGIISAKVSNCTDADNIMLTNSFAYSTYCPSGGSTTPYGCNDYEVTAEQLQAVKRVIDSGCTTALYSRNIPGKQIVSLDDVWYFDPGPSSTFGMIHQGTRVFSPPLQNPSTFYDSSGMDVMYKIFCMDIDGIPENSTATDCINECPFGYGIRADGKILNGAKADKWLEKSIQDKD